MRALNNTTLKFRMGFFDKFKQLFVGDENAPIDVNKRFDLLGRTGQGSSGYCSRWRTR